MSRDSIRRRVIINGSHARPLHEYVNLYFDAHNPMPGKCRAMWQFLRGRVVHYPLR